MTSVDINKKAPDFEIADFNGKKIKLSSFKGRSNILIVLNRGFL